LEKLKKSYQDRPDVVFVDISFDSEKKKWLKSLKASEPLGMQFISKNQQQTCRALGFQGIPMHLIVHPDGSYQKYEPLQTAKSILESSMQAR